ncbi:hypothetical protein D3C72_2497160 [compost metagenome]
MPFLSKQTECIRPGVYRFLFVQARLLDGVFPSSKKLKRLGASLPGRFQAERRIVAKRG